ncbi:hypothetical protein O6H91_10G086200 [Diphasiastrum complanatum]|uniref:Uncharacterized protein n=1 Tax=Diphasiastrum complanatum TaxID=34168 RepID=A0ACC2CJ23_DIPCM|nr:hypothetical protein O6H91_10G086200 [Diphasiastrum complanatum]
MALRAASLFQDHAHHPPRLVRLTHLPRPSPSIWNNGFHLAEASSSSFSSSNLVFGVNNAASLIFFITHSSSSLPVKLRHWKPCTVGCCKPSDGSFGTSDQKSFGTGERTLKADLQAAIQSEDYGKAATLRDQLRVLQEDDRAAVLSANDRFYRAFEKADMSLMQKIWAKGENVHCIHPGAGCISGYELVIASWEVMLGADPSLQLRIDLRNVEVHVSGDLGFVTCLEVVRTSGRSWGKQVATNIFEKQNGTWVICMHHASHIGS